MQLQFGVHIEVSVGIEFSVDMWVQGFNFSTESLCGHLVLCVCLVLLRRQEG